jgi:hypothetical protein
MYTQHRRLGIHKCREATLILQREQVVAASDMLLV